MTGSKPEGTEPARGTSLPPSRESAGLRREHPVPPDVRDILEDSLTDRGMRQWWVAENRLLDARPCDVWKTHGGVSKVKGAAEGFSQGFYV